MSEELALRPHWRVAIDELLRKHVPECEVWAYGSRVNGQGHDASALDIVVRAPALRPVGTALSALRTALQDSNVPILVQVHDWALLPEAFHNEIEREHIVIQSETTPNPTPRQPA